MDRHCPVKLVMKLFGLYLSASLATKKPDVPGVSAEPGQTEQEAWQQRADAAARAARAQGGEGGGGAGGGAREEGEHGTQGGRLHEVVSSLSLS